jgi:hypothetical protein
MIEEGDGSNRLLKPVTFSSKRLVPFNTYRKMFMDPEKKEGKAADPADEITVEDIIAVANTSLSETDTGARTAGTGACSVKVSSFYVD